MQKVVRSLALLLVGAVIAAVSLDHALGQDKKDKDKDKTATAVFEIYKGKKGYNFRYKDPSGKAVARSNGSYETKEEAVKAVEAMKKDAAKAKIEDASK